MGEIPLKIDMYLGKKHLVSCKIIQWKETIVPANKGSYTFKKMMHELVCDNDNGRSVDVECNMNDDFGNRNEMAATRIWPQHLS